MFIGSDGGPNVMPSSKRAGVGEGGVAAVGDVGAWCMSFAGVDDSIVGLVASGGTAACTLTKP